MPLNFSTDLTEKQETSSAGALQKSYNKPFNPNLLPENKEKFERIFFHSILPTLTDVTSGAILEKYFQASINQLLIDPRVLRNEAIHRIFLHRGRANFQYLQEAGTSALPSIQFSTSNSISREIRECLHKFSHAQESERTLYDISNLLAEWLIDASNEYQTFLVDYIQRIPLKNAQILLAALSDAEFSTNNENLLIFVGLFLKSTDKRLAQTAAVFLLTCGNMLGRDVLSQVLFAEEKLPHLQLIKGISELLS